MCLVHGRVKNRFKNCWSWFWLGTSSHPPHQCSSEGRQSHGWWSTYGGRVQESDWWWEIWMQVHVCSGVGHLELVFVPPAAKASGLKQTCSGVTLIRLFMIVYIMQTLSDVLLDCRFSSWSWATRAETLEVGLTSRGMRWADRQCTITNVDFGCCRCILWHWTHKAFAAMCLDSRLASLQVPVYAKAPTLLAFEAADWMCFPQWMFSVNSTAGYFALATLSKVWLWRV